MCILDRLALSGAAFLWRVELPPCAVFLVDYNSSCSMWCRINNNLNIFLNNFNYKQRKLKWGEKINREYWNYQKKKNISRKTLGNLGKKVSKLMISLTRQGKETNSSIKTFNKKEICSLRFKLPIHLKTHDLITLKILLKM